MVDPKELRKGDFRATKAGTPIWPVLKDPRKRAVFGFAQNPETTLGDKSAPGPKDPAWKQDMPKRSLP